MKNKVIVLLFAWAFFYGVAIAGAAAHRKQLKTDSLFAKNSNIELSELKVENR